MSLQHNAFQQDAFQVGIFGDGDIIIPPPTPGTEVPAGRRTSGRTQFQHYILRIDGQEFPCRSLKDALDLLERAKAFAKKVAQERTRAATERKAAFAPLPEPTIATNSRDLRGAVREAQQEIKSVYRQANTDMELMVLLHREMEREEDEVLMWLM